MSWNEDQCQCERIKKEYKMVDNLKVFNQEVKT